MIRRLQKQWGRALFPEFHFPCFAPRLKTKASSNAAIIVAFRSLHNYPLFFGNLIYFIYPIEDQRFLSRGFWLRRKVGFPQKRPQHLAISYEIKTSSNKIKVGSSKCTLITSSLLNFCSVWLVSTFFPSSFLFRKVWILNNFSLFMPHKFSKRAYIWRMKKKSFT